MRLRTVAVAAVSAMGAVSFAQSDMPVIPPPSARPPGAQTPAPPPQPPQLPPGARPATVPMEDLARAGFEVKSMVQAAGREGRYVVLMQRAGDVRTCLLRIAFGQGGAPVRQSACF